MISNLSLDLSISDFRKIVRSGSGIHNVSRNVYLYFVLNFVVPVARPVVFTFSNIFIPRDSDSGSDRGLDGSGEDEEVQIAHQIDFQNRFYRDWPHVLIIVQNMIQCAQCNTVLFRSDERIHGEGGDFLVFPVKVSFVIIFAQHSFFAHNETYRF